MGTNNGTNLILKTILDKKKNVLPPKKNGSKPLNMQQIAMMYNVLNCIRLNVQIVISILK
jgi:hypothetical protein